MRYLLEAACAARKVRVRITAQLIEAETGPIFVGRQVRRPDRGGLRSAGPITASVLGTIEPSLRGAEIARAERKRPDNLGAYDLYLRALPHA